jgi:hypothetical protein
MSITLKRFLEKKEDFLELIRSGYTEPKALKVLDCDRGIYSLACIKHPEFDEAVLEAKKQRADVFYEKIVDSVDTVLEKDEVPAAKLRIDTLKYLASVDNPDKYSEKVKHQHDVNINIFQEMKELPAHTVKELISSSDPFAVEAEFTPVEEDDDLEELL